MILKAIHGEEAIVDDKYFEFLNKFSWCVNPDGYFACTRSGTWCGEEVMSKKLHWFIVRLLGQICPKGMVLDHANRNIMDNCRENLRFLTATQNILNSKERKSVSGVRGVCQHGNNWRVQVTRVAYTLAVNTYVLARSKHPKKLGMLTSGRELISRY